MSVLNVLLSPDRLLVAVGTPGRQRTHRPPFVPGHASNRMQAPHDSNGVGLNRSFPPVALPTHPKKQLKPTLPSPIHSILE
jgi:hypothetical protein